MIRYFQNEMIIAETRGLLQHGRGSTIFLYNHAEKCARCDRVAAPFTIRVASTVFIGKKIDVSCALYSLVVAKGLIYQKV